MSIAKWMDGTHPTDGIGIDARGEIMDKAGIAELYGLTLYAVNEAIARGAPVLRKGSRKLPWQINTAAFLAWYIRDKGTPAFADPQAEAFHNAKTRRMVAQAERVEMDNERKRANTITIEEALAAYREEVSVVRTALAKVPARSISKLGDTWTSQEAEAAIRDTIDDALVEISDGKRSVHHGNA